MQPEQFSSHAWRKVVLRLILAIFVFGVGSVAMGQSVTFRTPIFRDPNILFPASGLADDFRAYMSVRGPSVSLDLEEGVSPIDLLGTDVHCATPAWQQDGRYSVAITVYEHSGLACPEDSCTTCPGPKDEGMMIGSAQWCLTVAAGSFAEGSCDSNGNNENGTNDDDNPTGPDAPPDDPLGALDPDPNSGSDASDSTDASNAGDPNSGSDASDSTDASNAGDDSQRQNRRTRDSSWRHAIPPAN